MSDWPNPKVLPTHLNTFMRYFNAWSMRTAVTTNPASASWPAANQAIYMPFSLPWPYPVARVWWMNGSALGNVSAGIFTVGGAQIWASGSTAQSGASAVQYLAPGSTICLPPGDYFYGLSNDGTTNRMFLSTSTAVPTGKLQGLYQQASAHPLSTQANPAVFAAWNSTGLPFCGLTRTASGF